MISHQDKCIFVHIPKAAGQSVEDVFVKRMGLTWTQREALLLKPNRNPKFGPPRLAHLFADEYIKYGHIEQNIFDNYFKFSFVRNPWARLVSEFNYRKSHGDLAYQGSFSDFVLTQFPTAEADDFVLAKDYYRHVIPQTQFLYNAQGECKVDFIGKFENLQQDFNFVCDNLKLGRIQLEHKNKTQVQGFKSRLKNILRINKNQTKHYTQYYDEATFEFVSQYYKNDIDNFKYTFDN